MQIINALFFDTPIEGTNLDKQFKEIFRDRIYYPYVAGHNKDLTVIDAGANIGLASYFFYPYSQVVFAIEPDPRHFEALHSMMIFNKFKDLVPVQVALANKDGMADFYRLHNSTMNSLVPAPDMPQIEKIKVSTMRLDTLFQEYAIDSCDILKADLEGGEYDVFGGDGFANVASRISLVIGEMHSWGDRNVNQFKESFIDNGFTFEIIKGEAMLFVAKNKAKK